MRSNQGFLLITVLLISVVLLLLVFGASVTSLIDRQSAANQRAGSESYYVAKAGLEHFKSATLNALATAHESEPTEEEENEDVDVCALPIADKIEFADGVALESGTDVDGNANVLTFRFDDSDDYYELSYDIAGPIIYLRSVGHAGRSTSTVQLVATVGAGPTGVYHNSIFTPQLTPGPTAGMAGIVAVHGSLHIVEGDATVDEDDVDLTGNVGIFNNYAGKDDATSLQEQADSLFSTEEMRYQDLCTRVKIHDGSLEVGETNTAAGTRVGAEGETKGIPNPIYGIYLDENSAVTSKGDPIDPMEEEDVHVRNPLGDYEPYQDNVLPPLSNPYPPDQAGSLTVRTVSAVSEKCDLIDTTGERPVLRLPPETLPAGPCNDEEGNAILSWDSDSRTLVVESTEAEAIAFPDMDFEVEKGEIVYYEGEASFFFGKGSARNGEEPDGAFESNMLLEGQFRPLGSVGSEYLTDSVIGLITNGGVTLNVNPDDGGNKGTIASLIYAEGTVEVKKQVAVFGALVAGEVTTEQVPSVAFNNKVPLAAKRIGMPGSQEPTVHGVFVNLSEERR